MSGYNMKRFEVGTSINSFEIENFSNKSIHPSAIALGGCKVDEGFFI